MPAAEKHAAQRRQEDPTTRRICQEAARMLRSLRHLSGGEERRIQKIVRRNRAQDKASKQAKRKTHGFAMLDAMEW